MKTKWIALLLCLLFTLAACGTSSPVPSEKAAGPELLSGFTTKDLDGNIVDESILRGKKVTVVNVWASYCGPCLREMPELQALSEEMADKDVQVIGIVLDGTDLNYRENVAVLEEARSIVQRTGVTYPSLIPCRDLAALCATQSFPTTFFVDETGRQIGEAYVGARNLAQWRTLVEAALEALS